MKQITSKGKTPHSYIQPLNRGRYRVIIDTPRGSRIKYKFDEELGCFVAGKILPAGHSFPYNFGFIPNTCAEDGDPLDVLVLLEESAALGSLVEVRLIGVIEAQQTEEEQTVRNDRLIGIAAEDEKHRKVKSLRQVETRLIEEIEHFLISYNQMEGKKFRVLGRKGEKAANLVFKKSLESDQEQ